MQVMPVFFSDQNIKQSSQTIGVHGNTIKGLEFTLPALRCFLCQFVVICDGLNHVSTQMHAGCDAGLFWFGFILHLCMPSALNT